MEYSDRYGGQGGPDPDTTCRGECEGLGFYPEYQGETDEEGRILIDGIGEWKIVTCPDCGGTGRSDGGPN